VSVFSNFMKKTIIGGIIFLIPLALLLFAAGELFDALSGISDKIGDVLFPNSDAPIISFLISLAILLGAAFVAGLLAVSGFGSRLGDKTHQIATKNVPGYAAIRQIIVSIIDGNNDVSNVEKIRVVKVDLGHIERFGMVVEQTGEDEFVVFLPGAPSAFSGIVVIVNSAQMTDIDMKLDKLILGLSMRGRGLADGYHK